MPIPLFRIQSFAWLLAVAICWQGIGQEELKVPEPTVSSGTSFYVVPVQDMIGPPTLFAIRNGVKDAIENNVEVLVLDMDTPGGRLDVTLEILEVLDRFPGRTVTYIRSEATSAGAIIASVTNEIYFAPKATMGSSEVVSGDGKDIQESMKRKVTSFLNSKMEAYTDQYPYRSQVIIAMMDPDYELEIDGEVISPEGKLLNLNAKRALKEYGDPPRALLSSGTAEELDGLLDSLSVGGEKRVDRFDSTWSLDFAYLLMKAAPALFAIGMITVYIEFQTPGFGWPGIVGVTCFVVGMFGHHVAGLSGSEPMLVFVLGVILVFVEILLMPGVLFLSIPGVILMIGSLLWSMTDIWPENTPDFEWSISMLERPFTTMMYGFLLGIAMIFALVRFLPRSMVRGRMVLNRSISGDAQAHQVRGDGTIIIGKTGVATTDLFPVGEVDVEGSRIEASSAGGMIEKGAKVRVIRRMQFNYEVEEVQS